MPMAPHRLPSLPSPIRANPPAGANSGLDKIWGQRHEERRTLTGGTAVSMTGTGPNLPFAVAARTHNGRTLTSRLSELLTRNLGLVRALLKFSLFGHQVAN